MSWVEYMQMAAQHSKGSAAHWFRYLSKYINQYGTTFHDTDINTLCNSGKLSPFQQVSLKAAFTNGSATRQHIISLNEPGRKDVLSKLREEFSIHTNCYSATKEAKHT